MTDKRKREMRGQYPAAALAARCPSHDLRQSCRKDGLAGGTGSLP